MGGATISLSAIDEALFLDEGTVPWITNAESAGRHIDPGRLRAAFNVALAHHELGRCAVGPDGRGGYAWVPVEGTVDIGPIEVVDCPDEAAVEALRRRQLDTPMRLDQAPLFRVVIARRGDDDLMISCVSHVLSDGIGMLRFHQSVSRAYLGVADPPPAIDVRSAQRQLALPMPADLGSLVGRWAQGLSDLAAAAVPRTRLAPGGGDPDDIGCALINRTVDVGAARAARAGRGTMFDDYAVAAAHLAIDRWNRDQGESSARLGVALGVNLRGFEWFYDVVANLATFASTTTDPQQRGSFESVIEAIGPQLEPMTRFERARLVAETTRMARLVPAATRRQLLGQLTADRYDTLVMSNGGVITDPVCFEPGVHYEGWVTQPALPAVGAALALHVVGEQLRVSLRYRRERFSEAGAASFVDAYLDALLTGR